MSLLAIGGGRPLSHLETTVLLSLDEILEALRKASEIQYRPPGAWSLLRPLWGTAAQGTSLQGAAGTDPRLRETADPPLLFP